jgi:hypothetical protein
MTRKFGEAFYVWDERLLYMTKTRTGLIFALTPRVSILPHGLYWKLSRL